LRLRNVGIRGVVPANGQQKVIRDWRNTPEGSTHRALCRGRNALEVCFRSLQSSTSLRRANPESRAPHM
jgi:hypothetical protein